MTQKYTYLTRLEVVSKIIDLLNNNIEFRVEKTVMDGKFNLITYRRKEK